MAEQAWALCPWSNEFVPARPDAMEYWLVEPSSLPSFDFGAVFETPRTVATRGHAYWLARTGSIIVVFYADTDRERCERLMRQAWSVVLFFAWLKREHEK